MLGPFGQLLAAEALKKALSPFLHHFVCIPISEIKFMDKHALLGTYDNHTCLTGFPLLSNLTCKSHGYYFSCTLLIASLAFMTGHA